MYYANAQQLADEICALVDSADPPLQWFCIEASAIDDVDFSSAETIRSVQAILEAKGVRLVVAQALADEDSKSRDEFRELLGPQNIYETLYTVLKAYEERRPGHHELQ
jgi:SulP family sulfate permease